MSNFKSRRLREHLRVLEDNLAEISGDTEIPESARLEVANSVEILRQAVANLERHERMLEQLLQLKELGFPLADYKCRACGTVWAEMFGDPDDLTQCWVTLLPSGEPLSPNEDFRGPCPDPECGRELTYTTIAFENDHRRAQMYRRAKTIRV